MTRDFPPRVIDRLLDYRNQVVLILEMDRLERIARNS